MSTKVITLDRAPNVLRKAAATEAIARIVDDYLPGDMNPKHAMSRIIVELARAGYDIAEIMTYTPSTVDEAK